MSTWRTHALNWMDSLTQAAMPSLFFLLMSKTQTPEKETANTETLDIARLRRLAAAVLVALVVLPVILAPVLLALPLHLQEPVVVPAAQVVHRVLPAPVARFLAAALVALALILLGSTTTRTTTSGKSISRDTE